MDLYVKLQGLKIILEKFGVVFVKLQGISAKKFTSWGFSDLRELFV
jgi:hypothetical protein